MSERRDWTAATLASQQWYLGIHPDFAGTPRCGHYWMTVPHSCPVFRFVGAHRCVGELGHKPGRFHDCECGAHEEDLATLYPGEDDA